MTLDELTPIARAAIDTPGSERLRGFAEACMFACFLGFLRGDIDDYADLTERASAIECVAGGVTSSCLAMFQGDMDLAVEHAARASELARDAEAQLLAWTLAHCAVMESYVPVKSGAVDPSTIVDMRAVTQARAEEALRIGRSVPGTIARQYPLLSVATSALAEDRSGPDVSCGLSAAEEIAAIDRTQRRFWSTTVGSAAANALASQSGASDQLVKWRAILRDHYEHDEPFMFVLLLASVSESLVEVEPPLAVELAAIAESGVIAPSATFTVFPNLIQRAADDPVMAADARARAARMTRDEAYARVLSGIDEVIARRGMA